MKKDEDDVHKVIDIIESWIHPFTPRDTTEPLINIASGMKADDRITDDLLTAHHKGNEPLVTFVDKRMQTREVDFFATLSKSNLQIFGILVKLKRAKSATTDIIIKADKGLFARMVVTAEHQQINMQEFLKYPL